MKNNNLLEMMEMSELIGSVVGNLLIIIGLCLVLTSLLGIKRFEDSISKLHATAISDGFGMPLCYFGLFLLNITAPYSLKYILLVCLTIVTTPLISQAIAYFIYKSKKEDNEDA